MKWNVEQLDNLPIHFVLCTERTGSSLLSLMLNLNTEILSPSEEPFALYFWKKYEKKRSWSKKDILDYVDAFFLLAEKNTDLYFSKKEKFISNLLEHKEILTFHRIIKLTYLNFLDVKDKSGIKCIIDKQIKYFFHLQHLQQIFPGAKYIVLTRDVRDNIVSKRNRKLNWNQNPLFLAALWNDTYQQTKYLKEQQFIRISYEKLMTETETELKKICKWVACDYTPKMLEINGVYNSFLDAKAADVDPIFIQHLRDFHSGLSQKPNTHKIGQYATELDHSLLDQIEQICGESLVKMGYNLSINKHNTFSITQWYYKTLAIFYRRYLLHLYYFIPLAIKLLIKKRKGKKIHV